MSCLKVIYGAGSAGSWRNEVEGPEVPQVLEEFGVGTIDTARIYAFSEELIGKWGVTARFNIDTKHPGGFSANTPATKENVDVYYLHAPDRRTPLEQTLDGVNELFKQGRFKRFGLSNFLASEVEEVIRVSKENGFVVPTVYQGNYSAVARRQESELFPVLRKHGIAFNAYSPLAGGLLTKTAKDLEGSAGRFDPANPIGGLYMTLYKKPAYLAARWVAYNSSLKPENGDGIVIGARNLDQLRKTLTGLKNGPLPDQVVKQIDEVWDKVKGEAGLDNYNLNNV